MPEKLITIKEAAAILGLSEEEIRRLAAVGEIPAYKVGGTFLRFRKEQIDAIRAEITGFEAAQEHPAEVNAPVVLTPAEQYDYSFLERVGDFLYFHDFYIISFAVIFSILFFLFK